MKKATGFSNRVATAILSNVVEFYQVWSAVEEQVVVVRLRDYTNLLMQTRLDCPLALDRSDSILRQVRAQARA